MGDVAAGTPLGEVDLAAEEAAQKITPEEAMEKVAKSIEELNNNIKDLVGGPLADFIEGFKDGILNSEQFHRFYSHRIHLPAGRLLKDSERL